MEIGNVILALAFLLFSPLIVIGVLLIFAALEKCLEDKP